MRPEISRLDAEAPTQRERLLSLIFRVAMVLVLLVGAWQCRHGWPVSSSLLDLLPTVSSDKLRHEADAQIQKPLTRQMVALVGAPDRERAVELARGLGHLWNHSGLFAKVQVDADIDLDAVRQQMATQRLSLISGADRQRFMHDPAAYAAQRVRELVDPFSVGGLVPTDQDLLGLARMAEKSLRPPGKMHFDLTSGTLLTEQDGKYWVLLRAQTSGDAFDQRSPAAIAALVNESRAGVARDGGELLATGGALYAAAGQSQAQAESAWIGGGSLLGIVLLLLLAMRRWRVLLAFVPVAAGLLCGIVACVAAFGSVHILTLVIGASLIGIAVDFPLHYLGKSYGLPDWTARDALRRVLPGLSIILAATLVGYLALLFTPFPALTQTAVFSAAGLVGAYACTVCELPRWLRGWAPRPWQGLPRLAQSLLDTLSVWTARRTLPWLALGVALVCAGGLLKLRVQDDLRLWVNLPPTLLDQAKRIGEITGIMPTSQYFLVRAPDLGTLYQRQADLGQNLDALIKKQALASYLSLNQLLAPESAQQQLRDRMRDPSWRARLTPSFETVGVPASTVLANVDGLVNLPPVKMTDALAGPLGESRRDLWLGEHDGQVAAIISLQGLRDTSAVAAAAQGLDGVSYIDQTGDLNRSFASTRWEAAQLKLLSYLVAAVLLWITLGRHATWRLLAVPLAASACTLGALGILGQPLTLFSLFGLLLVSAIGLDYAIVMYERVAGAASCLIGVVLAALTTLLSFGLLGLSSTPAIANFGIAVALGVGFSVLFAPWVRPTPETPHPPTH